MLFTPCSHPVHTNRFSQPQASIKLDPKSVVPRSTDIVRADHRQADKLQASWPPRSHQGAVAYSENGVRELARLFRKRRMSVSRTVAFAMLRRLFLAAIR